MRPKNVPEKKRFFFLKSYKKKLYIILLHFYAALNKLSFIKNNLLNSYIDLLQKIDKFQVLIQFISLQIVKIFLNKIKLKNRILWKNPYGGGAEKNATILGSPLFKIKNFSFLLLCLLQNCVKILNARVISLLILFHNLIPIILDVLSEFSRSSKSISF